MGGRLASVAAIAVAATIALAACGSGSDGTTSTSGESTPAKTTGEGKERARSGFNERAARSRLRASILGFGKAASAAETDAAAAAVSAFYEARVDEDWHTACPYLSAEMRGRVKQIGGAGDAGCGKGIEALTATASVSDGEETVAEVKGLRRRDSQGFLIYMSGGEKENAMLVEFEKGEWKLAGLNATPLPPSP